MRNNGQSSKNSEIETGWLIRASMKAYMKKGGHVKVKKERQAGYQILC